MPNTLPYELSLSRTLQLGFYPNRASSRDQPGSRSVLKSNKGEDQ